MQRYNLSKHNQTLPILYRDTISPSRNKISRSRTYIKSLRIQVTSLSIEQAWSTQPSLKYLPKAMVRPSQKLIVLQILEEYPYYIIFLQQTTLRCQLPPTSGTSALSSCIGHKPPNLMSTILNRNLLRQEIRPSLVSTISQNYSMLLYDNLGLWNGLHRFEVY